MKSEETTTGLKPLNSNTSIIQTSPGKARGTRIRTKNGGTKLAKNSLREITIIITIPREDRVITSSIMGSSNSTTCRTLIMLRSRINMRSSLMIIIKDTITTTISHLSSQRTNIMEAPHNTIITNLMDIIIINSLAWHNLLTLLTRRDRMEFRVPTKGLQSSRILPLGVSTSSEYLIVKVRLYGWVHQWMHLYFTYVW